MKLFFESVIDEVFNNLVLEKTYFIIPNQRSKAFLKREILKKLSSITISPQIYSIDDFIEKIADSKEATRTNQLFYLYFWMYHFPTFWRLIYLYIPYKVAYYFPHRLLA